MAQIVAATQGDPYSLHLELDYLMADFPTAMLSIMKFLQIEQQFPATSGSLQSLHTVSSQGDVHDI